MGCAQAAIGILNDYCDRALDAVSKPEKPLVRGTVQPGEALALVVILTGLALLAAQQFGVAAVLILCAIMALGFAYDLRFKGTPISALLFALHFPLLPIFVWASLGVWQPFLPWILPLGAALGIAMNIANSLPDLPDDSAAGVRGLPHVLGLRRDLALVWSIPHRVESAYLAARSHGTRARAAALAVAGDVGGGCHDGRDDAAVSPQARCRDAQGELLRAGVRRDGVRRLLVGRRHRLMCRSPGSVGPDDFWIRVI